MSDKPVGSFIFGFDIGIASVGWCVLAEGRIIDLGVRCFDKAETAKEGESLNLARRAARLMRRRLRRRAWRLTKLARLLKREGLIDNIQSFRQPAAKSLWQLRVEGLDRKLSSEEWARVLYHLCKHRGFHWISRAEKKKAEGDGGEGGKVKKGLVDTEQRMAEKNYRSAAEMVLTEFPEAQRNKQGDYGKALSRVLLAEELALLFQKQREYGNPHATPELEMHIAGCGNRKSGLFWEQKSPFSGKDLLKMLGHCTFEKNEYRAPKASFTAERHVWLTKLVNLKVVVDGVTRRLQPEEVKAVLSLPYEYKSALTYKQLHSALIEKGFLPKSFVFSGLTGKKDKDPLDQTLVTIPAWHEIRKTLEKADLKTEWQSIAGAATGGQSELLDQIAWTLSVFKDDDEVEQGLRKLPLPGGEKMIKELSEISFDKFHNLSLKALRKIVPHMEAGLRYDEACEKAGYHHSQLFKAGEGQQKYLPPFYSGRDKDGRMVFDEKEDIPRNPVVLRSLNQARKVLNALVSRYGSPSSVHIEMARDLSRPMDERNKIKKAQEEFRDRNEKAKADFEAEYNMPAKSREFEKFMLYREQHGKCAYSLRPFDLDRVLNEPGYAEVDHALPYSRSYDNSKNNKVLVFASENRNKGNHTPYEYLTSFTEGENGERWLNFVAYVQGNKSYRLAKRTRLLRKNFGEDESKEFMERNLNDTRYICKFFKSYVERYLQLAEGSDSRRCVVLSGQLTAFLRARWGLTKVRGDNDRHHALDAAVVAACSHALVQRLSNYSKRKELEQAKDAIDAETGEIRDLELLAKLEQHFPKPWEYFREELLLRLNTDDPALLKSEAQHYGYPPETLENLRPLFVSRAPQRRNSGAAHKETIYAKPRLEHKLMVDAKTKEGKSRQAATPEELEGMVIERLGVFDTTGQGKAKKYRFTLEHLKNIVGHDRNRKMVDSLELWLKERGDDPNESGIKTFPRKPQKSDPKEGPFTGPEIKTVKLNGGKMTGISVRGGVTQNDTMLRVDVFRHKKDKKYHLVPVYVHHAVAEELPIRAIVASKDEDDWTLIDEVNFDFCFSLYPNDLVKVSLKKEASLGYYAGCDRSTGAISLWIHDRNKGTGKDGLIRGIGVKTALCIEKFHVDALGNIYPAPLEERRGLA